MTFLIFNLNSIPVTIYFNAYIANEFLQCLLFWSNMHWSGLMCYKISSPPRDDAC